MKETEDNSNRKTDGILQKLNDINQTFSINKITRFLLFLFFFFFIFKIIDHILFFFDISRENGYAYFSWFTLVFFLFILLPTQRSRLTTYTYSYINSIDHKTERSSGVAAAAAILGSEK